MPVVFAIIGFFALFIPTRCVGCTIGLGTGTEFEHGEYAEYFYYDGSVHEFESDGGKEVGLIPGGTIFCEVNAKKENVVCYKLQGKTPVRTYIKSGDSAGERHSGNIVAQTRKFFIFWQFKHVGVGDFGGKDFREKNSGILKWDDFFEVAQKKANADARAFFDKEFSTISISKHPSDDFDGDFRKSIKGSYELSGKDYPSLKDKSMLYFLTPQEYKKMKKIKKNADALFRKKYEEYCSPLPVYATSCSLPDGMEYPFSVEKL